jgi:hypothetical protein
MTPNLEKKLFTKYPKIFRQKDLNMQETCMCWGIECGDGWYWLIDNVCGSIQNYIDDNKGVEQVEASQVKEKFGGLRFYTSGNDDRIDGMIWLAESLSYKICENCGSQDNVKQTKGWIVSLCPKCTEERMKKLGVKK